MQFRERRRVIQVIRTVYDPAIKRGRAEVVGRIDKDDPRLDDEIARACSPDELAEINAFLAEHTRLMSRDATRAAAEDLARQMRLAEAWFNGMAGAEGGAVAAEIYTAWEGLKKALHKAGYRKGKNAH